MALTYKDRPLDFWVPAIGSYLSDDKRLVEVVAADKGGIKAHDALGHFNDPREVLIPLVHIAEGKWHQVVPRAS